MNKIHINMKFFLMITLVINTVFCTLNFPYNLDPMVGSNEDTFLIGSDSIAFSWEPPEDDYGLSLFISSIIDSGDGNISFAVSCGKKADPEYKQSNYKYINQKNII